MFEVKMVGLGGKKELREFTTSVDTLAEAELLAGAEAAKDLETEDVSLVHTDELIYEVISDGRSAGTVCIRSI